MKVEDLEPGDVLVYPPSMDMLAFLGIAFGEWLATGKEPSYVHVGIWTGFGEVSAYTDVGVASGGKYPFKCDVLRPMVPEWDIVKGLAWLDSKIGKTPYNWVGLLWVWIAHRLNKFQIIEWDDRSTICSALAARFLRKCGLVPFPLLFDAEVMPTNFDSAIGLQYVGTIYAPR